MSAFFAHQPRDASMGILSKWMRWLIQAISPGLKAQFDVYMPHLKQRVGNYAFDRIDQVALARFVQSHTLSSPVERSFKNGLAVVIPCFNHADYLEATVTCLLNQTYRPFQVIFVEDHSTDETWARLHYLTSNFPDNIKVTLQRNDRNRGQSASINLGIEQTRASLYTILNDDDYLAHDGLEAIVEILRDRSDLYLLGAGARPFGGIIGPPIDAETWRIAHMYPEYTAIPLVEYTPSRVPTLVHANDLNMAHSGTTFFRGAWQAVGGYYTDRDARVVVFADRDFQLRVAGLFPVSVSKVVPFSYWRDDSSVDTGKYS